MFGAGVVIGINGGLVNANALHSNGFANLEGDKSKKLIYSALATRSEQTYAVLEGSQIRLGQSICLRDNRDEVDTRTEALHDFDVKRFETALPIRKLASEN